MNTKPLIILLAGVVSCFGQDEVTSLKLRPFYADHKITLSKALAEIGLHVEGGYVSFSIDLRGPSEPEVELDLRNPSTLGEAIAQVTSQASGYTYQVVSKHVVDIYTAEAISDPAYVLNLMVDSFQVSRQSALNIFSQPKRFIPQLQDYFSKGATQNACGGLGPGLGSSGPGVTLSLQRVTVKQVLDAVAEADAELLDHVKTGTVPVGWVHKVTVDPRTGPVHSWSFLSSVPRGWERFQVSRPITDNQKDGLAKSNKVAVTVVP